MQEGRGFEEGSSEPTSPEGDDVRRLVELAETLKERNEELEQINRVLIGRELRMVELKDRLERLERGMAGKDDDATAS